MITFPLDLSIEKRALSQFHVLSAFKAGCYSKIWKKRIFRKTKRVMIMVKNSLIQHSPIEVSLLRNVNFEFVTCVQIKIVICKLYYCHYCKNPHSHETLLVVCRS